MRLQFYKRGITCMAMGLAIGSVIIASATTVQAAKPKKPNIIVMMADNLGWGELGSYGGGILRGAATPRIDKLASEGIRFLNFNVETQCVPSRSALMTGRHPVRSGTSKVVWGMLYGMTQWERTMPELLSDEGYATAMYGKWHLGSTKGRFPTDQGFDEWYGIANTTDESLYEAGFQYDPAEVPLPKIVESVKGKTPKAVKTYNEAARREIDSELTRRTIDFMERNVKAEKPFFAYVPFTQVHLPTLPHPDFKGKTGNGHFADVLAEMDHRVGQVLDAVDRLKIRDNTIVIFTSDNGPEEVFPYNGTAGPWRGTYFTALEGSLRAPFLIRWPDRIKAGQVHNEIMHITDLLPTLARAAGATVPTDRIIDGVDQFDFLTGKVKKSARDGFPVYNGDGLFAYKWRNWKMHFTELPTMGSLIVNPGMPRLYHLLRDPKEQYDLIHYGGKDGFWVMPAIMERLAEHKKTLMKEPPIQLGTPDPYVPGKK